MKHEINLSNPVGPSRLLSAALLGATLALTACGGGSSAEPASDALATVRKASAPVDQGAPRRDFSEPDLDPETERDMAHERVPELDEPAPAVAPR